MKLETKITLALIALVAYAFFTAIDVFAAPILSGRTGDCNGLSVNPRNADHVDYCRQSPPAVVTSQPETKHDDQPEQPTTQQPAPVVNETPANDEPKHCNKGKGNGSEGCDPGNNPDLGNDDE